MKCIRCENELPNKRGFVRTNRNGKVEHGKKACCLPGCPSFDVDPRSKLFQIVVMGLSETELFEKNKRRMNKVRETKIRRQSQMGDNNPMSKAQLRAQGMSDEEIKQKLSKRSKKACNTKRKSGYYLDKANNPYSLLFWLDKKGLSQEQAELKKNERMHNRPEFWLKKGYSEEAANQKSKRSAAINSLERKIEIWGVDGERKYLEACQAVSAGWNPSCVSSAKFSSSNQANNFFKKVYKECRKLGYQRNDVAFKLNRGEWYIKDKKRIFFYDFMLKPLKLIVEFNGEHVHPDKRMGEDQWSCWKHAYSKKSADEVYASDQEKMYTASKRGYNILEVWSRDQDNLETVLNFIRRHHEHLGN